MGFDVYSMKPVSGSSPTVFVSEVAPVQQGAYSASGKAQQVLVPNRKPAGFSSLTLSSSWADLISTQASGNAFDDSKGRCNVLNGLRHKMLLVET